MAEAPEEHSWRPMIHYAATSIGFMSSFLLIVPALYGLARNGILDEISSTMLMSGCLVLALGLLVREATRTEHPLRPLQAIYVTVATWLLVPLVVAAPVALALHIPFIDAWFESVSGLTTTGLSVFSGSFDAGRYVPRVSEAPPEILLWRSLCQWVGGLGIVVFMIAVFAHPRVVTPLYYAEGRFERLEPSLRRTVRELLLLYVTLTTIAVVVLILAGMDAFDAVNHAFTSLSTGGFSTRDESIAYYGSRIVELATMFTMWLGAMNFLDHKYLLTGRVRRFLSSVEFRTFFWIMALGIGGVEWMTWMSGGRPGQLWSMIYQFFSALTTTGYQTMNIHASGDAFKMLLVMAMLMGGSVFSTAGGMKLLRVALGFEAFKLQVKKMFYPRGYTPRYRLDRYAVSPEILAGALIIAFLYIAVAVLSAMVVFFYAPGYSFMDALFEAASAVGTVGLSAGISSASLAPVAKLVLIADMLLGRLEVLPYILVIYSMVRRLL